MKDKAKAKEVVRKALQIASLMNEICALGDSDSEINELLGTSYPFAQSLDEVFCEVIVWRDAMAEKAEVPLYP